MRLAQELQVIFVHQNKCCHLVWPMSHPCYHIPRTPSTSRTSPSSLGWQVAPSWRPAEWAQQLPEVISPKYLRPSRESKHIQEIHINFFDVQENFGKEDHRSPITEEVEEFGEVRTPWNALQTLISKMESYRRCWLHHCVPRKLRGPPMHCSRLNRETWSGVLFSETVIRRIWEDLFLKVIRITCSIRQDQTWRHKNFMSNLSISASVNYNDKRKSKDWHYRTYKTDLLNLDENKFDYKKNCPWKKVLRNTQIRNMHEMEEIKGAQELGADEVSVQKLRENHKTIQQHTCQLQQM